MDTEYLRSFSAVARCGSFSAAARELNKSQSTISGHIARLEDILGIRVFVRTTRKVQLTSDGRTLLDHASSVLSETDRIFETFRPSRLGGRIKVGISDEAYVFPLVTRGLQEFLQRQPNVSIEIVAGIADELEEKVENGEVDLVLVRSLHNGQEQLCVSRLSWISAPDFEWKEESTLPVAHIGERCCYFRQVRRVLEDAGIGWNRVVSCNSLQGLLASVHSGLAVAAVPEDEDIEPGLRSHRLNLPELPKFGLVFRYAEEKPSHLARIVAKSITNALENDAPPASQQ